MESNPVNELTLMEVVADGQPATAPLSACAAMIGMPFKLTYLGARCPWQKRRVMPMGEAVQLTSVEHLLDGMRLEEFTEVP